jgi:hypothetical protein
MTAHPAFAAISSYVPQEMILSPLGAKALCTVLLSTLYGLRVLFTSHLVRTGGLKTHQTTAIDIPSNQQGAGGRNRRSRPMQRASPGKVS